MVSCQKGPTHHAHACQIGPFLKDTREKSPDSHYWGYGARSSNELHWLDLNMGHQENVHMICRQSNMSYLRKEKI